MAVTRAVPGWVYVLVSQRDPRVVKIGRTTYSAYRRAEQLAETPGYRDFAPYAVSCSIAVFDCAFVEAASHRMLSHKRVRRRDCQELFWANPQEARRVVEAAARSLQGRPSSHFGRRAPFWRRRGDGRTVTAVALLVLFVWLMRPELLHLVATLRMLGFRL